MNAYELADEWKHTAFINEENKQNCGDRMEAMLRQQADRIAELEEFKNTSITPFAMAILDDNFEIAFYGQYCEKFASKMNHIRLYTHPVKQLSDEEIMEIATLMEINYGCVPPLEFAWAIIKEITE